MTYNDKKIYEICRPFHYMPDWDGEFLAIEDDYKDEAVFEWFKQHPSHLQDIFPVCWDARRSGYILVSIYTSSELFKALASSLMVVAPPEEIFESDQFRAGEAEEFELLLHNDDWAGIEQFWKHILYRYAEDELREICQEGYNNEK